MIERFNFYDLYGYLIPGVILTILVILPYGIVNPAALSRIEINGELVSLVFGIAIAYVVGYTLHSMATSAIPSSFGGRFPSVWLLNPSDATFSSDFKKTLSDRVKSAFGIDVDITQEANDEITRRRQNAFFLSRPKASSKESGSYSEQFQGLYSMMRGLSVDFFLGALYMAGWTASAWRPACMFNVVTGLILVIAVAFLVFSVVRGSQSPNDSKGKSVDRWCLTLVGLAFLTGGYLLGENVSAPWPALVLGILTVFYSALAARFYASYKLFSVTYAKSVWEGFVARSRS